jgi:hypothetical protein
MGPDTRLFRQANPEATRVHVLVVGWLSRGEHVDVYVRMQPPLRPEKPPPSASMGVEGGSDSRRLETVETSEAKTSMDELIHVELRVTWWLHELLDLWVISGVER